MFSDLTRDILNLLGVIISVLGFSFAIWQIFKIKKVAFAAKEAALKAREALQTNIILVDLSYSSKVINEIKGFIRNKRHEAGLIRVTDTITQLAQIRHMQCFLNDESSTSFQDMISRLSILRDNLEEKLINSDTTIDISLINKILSDIDKEINNLIGKCKFT